MTPSIAKRCYQRTIQLCAFILSLLLILCPVISFARLIECNIANTLFAITACVALVNLGITIFTTFGEETNKHTVQTISQEQIQLRREMNLLKSSPSPLSQCMKEAIDKYSDSEDFDKVQAIMDIQTRWLSGYDHMYYFQYLPEPTVWLSQQLAKTASPAFTPYKFRSIKLTDCEHFQHFLETSLDAHKKITPAYLDITASKELIYPVFSLSMKFCGGYLDSEELTIEHLCFSLVEALINVSEKDNKQLLMSKIYQNPFTSPEGSSIFLPVLGTRDSPFQDTSQTATHFVKLQRFTISKKNILKPTNTQL